MIYLGADHRGFKMKQKISKYLESLDEDFYDVGAFDFVSDDDYNDYAHELCLGVRLKKGNLGFLFCGSGVGMDVVANKHAGIRSALCFNSSIAKQSREHLGCNVASIPSDFLNFDDVKKIVDVFIRTPFSFEPRHARRVGKIVKLEEEFGVY